MLSMTGFGTGSASDGAGTVSVQIQSLNNRGCQLALRSELRDLALEEAIRRQVRDCLQRGSLTVNLGWQPATTVSFDRERLAQSWRELAALARELGAPPPALEQVAKLQGAATADGDAAAAATATAAVEQALAAVMAMRRREGADLLTALRGQAAALRQLLAGMDAAAAGRVARHRDALTARLREVLAQQVDEQVLVRELALYSERIDVSEELVRLASHRDALDALLIAGDDAVGRKLEFLLQELGREVNTVGSKSNDGALTRLVLEAKGLLEQLREQVANVA